MIEPLSSQHIDEVSEIHLTSWAPYEISVKLGSDYLKECFYSSIVQSKFAFGYVYMHQGKIIAYATGFNDYKKFFQEMKKNNYFKLVHIFSSKALTGKINFSDMLNVLLEHLPLKCVRYPRFHQNSLALRNEYKGTEIGKIAITDTITKVVEQLMEMGCPGCWGRTDDRNIAMKKYYLKLGFKEAGVSKQFNRKQVIFEKIF